MRGEQGLLGADKGAGKTAGAAGAGVPGSRASKAGALGCKVDPITAAVRSVVSLFPFESKSAPFSPAWQREEGAEPPKLFDLEPGMFAQEWECKCDSRRRINFHISSGSHGESKHSVYLECHLMIPAEYQPDLVQTLEKRE